jgi:hypothetical protein
MDTVVHLPSFLEGLAAGLHASPVSEYLREAALSMRIRASYVPPSPDQGKADAEMTVKGSEATR